MKYLIIGLQATIWVLVIWGMAWVTGYEMSWSLIALVAVPGAFNDLWEALVDGRPITGIKRNMR